MQKQSLNTLKSHAFQTLVNVGAANGCSNRARTFRSKREKMNDAKRQRKAKDWRKDE